MKLRKIAIGVTMSATLAFAAHAEPLVLKFGHVGAPGERAR
jgi:hypothetical protein